ncbi:(2Fe-2S)-binding protein [Pararhizobium mangrovi]|uniref:(2Fe-2S)-binding protein n=1 Tax=Pararhizobium mangrovi TaxID=2590452 RepID=A0A506UI39_9HYPH|nr:(2Fe-2S)-binding protein [Pararhizobium mangrovi]TPW32976.1 (2Fe-2S)-binding protein [Pararhizobium mangrovi]
MIVCHCNLIAQKEIEDTIVEMLDEDRWQLIVPAKVYHAMGKRGRCCGCFPNVVDTIIRVTRDYHAERHSTPSEIVDFMARLEELNRKGRRCVHERRSKDHRAA